MNRREAIAALISLPAVTRITVAALAPSDVIVIEYSGRMSKESAARIKETLGEVWPGHKCVVLSDGMTLKVVAS